MIETSSVPRKSSVIFGKSPKNVRKRSPYLRNNFGKSSEIFGKWSEIFGKSSKTSSLVCLYNKQNITCPLVDMNFIFSCLTRHLTRSLRSLVRYRVEHSKIKFISTRGHVISSISKTIHLVPTYLIEYSHKLFSVHASLEKFEDTSFTGHFGFVLEENWVREIT